MSCGFYNRKTYLTKNKACANIKDSILRKTDTERNKNEYYTKYIDCFNNGC